MSTFRFTDYFLIKKKRTSTQHFLKIVNKISPNFLHKQINSF